MEQLEQGTVVLPENATKAASECDVLRSETPEFSECMHESRDLINTAEPLTLRQHSQMCPPTQLAHNKVSGHFSVF